ncbi:hypothetical protein AB0N28_23555 [Streptomyces sp. NPDC051130]|uniref:hypothetical protein n=1 Tax=Streptomyces sp. NPDC051130 TaxID=3157223 RepID=UPI00343986E9
MRRGPGSGTEQAGHGSATAASPPGAPGQAGVATAEDEQNPVVAFSDEDGTARLPPGAQRRTAAGRTPVHPG